MFNLIGKKKSDVFISSLPSSPFLATSNNIIAIWIVSGIVVIVGVVQNFALMGILLAACLDKRRAMWYQFYAFVYALAALIWSSLGPILADIIGIQLVFYLIIMIYLPLLYIMPLIDKEFKIL